MFARILLYQGLSKGFMQMPLLTNIMSHRFTLRGLSMLQHFADEKGSK